MEAAEVEVAEVEAVEVEAEVAAEAAEVAVEAVEVEAAEVEAEVEVAEVEVGGGGGVEVEVAEEVRPSSTWPGSSFRSSRRRNPCRRRRTGSRSRSD